MKKWLLSVALISSITFINCEHARLTLGGYPDTEYHHTLHHLTQYQKLFGLEKVLFQTYVTYISPKLSDEYVDEYAKVFSLSEEKKKAMSDQAKADQEKYDEFIVAHYASELDNQKLNESRDEKIVWKFFIESSDHITLVEPVDIEPITMGTQRNYFYPHLDGWNKLYRIRFPKQMSEDKIFWMKGTIRQLKFVWKNP